MQIAVLLFASGILAIIAYGDVRTRRIPNRLVYAVGVCGLLRMILVGDPLAACYTVAAAVAVLAVGILLFWRGMLGGGDAKLLAATSLLVGHGALFDFLFVMALSGGLLALMVLAADKFGPWFRSIALPVGAYGGPVRLAVLAQGKLDRWLNFDADRAANSPGFEQPAGSRSRPTVPYGVAIAAAGIMILVLQTSSPG